MIRALVIFLVIAAIATVAAVLADNPGSLVIEAWNWEIRTSFSAAIVALAISILALLAIYRVSIALWKAPKNISASVRSRRQDKGLNALAKGLVAVAAGDAGEARKYVSQTESLLKNKALSGLLGAQSAQLDGDEKKANAYFETMLESPDTEFLGLRGLLVQATRKGDTVAALKHASRAFELRPKTVWAFQALIDLQTDGGDWNGALATLEQAKKSGVVDKHAERRRRSVLLTARASRANVHGDTAQAEADARQAQRLMPSLTHAAILAADQVSTAGNSWKAAAILEDAWREAPHPALVEAYVALNPDETTHERAKRLKGLAEMKPDHMESRLLLARQAINTRNWQNARDALESVVMSTPTSRVCALMAEIEQGDGNIGAAREWLARAVVAPPEPEWIRAHFDFETLDWAGLSRELGAPDAAWPPAPDPSLFVGRSGSVSPFTPELHPADDETIGPSTDESSGSGKAVIIETPIAVDHVPPEDQSGSADQEGSSSSGEALNAPHLSSLRASGGLKSVKPGRQAVSPSDTKGKSAVPKHRLSFKSTKQKGRSAPSGKPGAKQADSSLPRQPDDPGPDPQDRDDAPLW